MTERLRPASAIAPVALNRISQIGYVVHDLHEAIAIWTGQFAVGPFFVLPHLQFTEMAVNGVAAKLDISIALAWAGHVQVELVQQHNAGPTVFSDFAPLKGGVHHVGIRTGDISADEEKLLTAGMRRVQRGLSASGVETIFLYEPSLGVVELIGADDGGAFAQRIKDAADAWDGISPYAN